LIDYYLPSAEELRAVWGGKDIKEAAKNAGKYTKAVIIVKDGKNGAIGFTQNKFTEIPAFKVRSLNTIGAGDAFNAAFLKAQSMNLNLAESIRFACAAAAIKVSDSEFPSLPKIKKMLKAR